MKSFAREGSLDDADVDSNVAVATDAVAQSWWRDHIERSTSSPIIALMLFLLAWHSFRVNGMKASETCSIMFSVNHFLFLFGASLMSN